MVSRLRCPKCFSTLIYYRSRKGNYICRRCGSVFVLPLVENLA